MILKKTLILYSGKNLFHQACLPGRKEFSVEFWRSERRRTSVCKLSSSQCCLGSLGQSKSQLFLSQCNLNFRIGQKNFCWPLWAISKTLPWPEVWFPQAIEALQSSYLHSSQHGYNQIDLQPSQVLGEVSLLFFYSQDRNRNANVTSKYRSPTSINKGSTETSNCNFFFFF